MDRLRGSRPSWKAFGGFPSFGPGIASTDPRPNPNGFFVFRSVGPPPLNPREGGLSLLSTFSLRKRPFTGHTFPGPRFALLRNRPSGEEVTRVADAFQIPLERENVFEGIHPVGNPPQIPK